MLGGDQEVVRPRASKADARGADVGTREAPEATTLPVQLAPASENHRPLRRGEAHAPTLRRETSALDRRQATVAGIFSV